MAGQAMMFLFALFIIMVEINVCFTQGAFDSRTDEFLQDLKFSRNQMHYSSDDGEEVNFHKEGSSEESRDNKLKRDYQYQMNGTKEDEEDTGSSGEMNEKELTGRQTVWNKQTGKDLYKNGKHRYNRLRKGQAMQDMKNASLERLSQGKEVFADQIRGTGEATKAQMNHFRESLKSADGIDGLLQEYFHLSIADLTKEYIPSGMLEFTVDELQFIPDTFKLKLIELSLKSPEDEEIELFKGVTLRDIEIKLIVAKRVEQFTVKAKANIFGIEVEINGEIRYKKFNFEASLRTNLQTVLNKLSSGYDVPSFDFGDIRVELHLKASIEFTVGAYKISFEANVRQDDLHFKFLLLLEKSFAIIVQFPEGINVEKFKKITSLDEGLKFDNLPFMKKFDKSPWCITVASRKMSLDEVDTLDFVEDCRIQDNSIPSGFHIKLFNDMRGECGIGEETKDGNTDEFEISFSNGKAKIDFPRYTVNDILSFAKCFIPKLNEDITMFGASFILIDVMWGDISNEEKRSPAYKQSKQISMKNRKGNSGNKGVKEAKDLLLNFEVELPFEKIPVSNIHLEKVKMKIIRENGNLKIQGEAVSSNSKLSLHIELIKAGSSSSSSQKTPSSQKSPSKLKSGSRGGKKGTGRFKWKFTASSKTTITIEDIASLFNLDIKLNFLQIENFQVYWFLERGKVDSLSIEGGISINQQPYGKISGYLWQNEEYGKQISMKYKSTGKTFDLIQPKRGIAVYINLKTLSLQQFIQSLFRFDLPINLNWLSFNFKFLYTNSAVVAESCRKRRKKRESPNNDGESTNKTESADKREKRNLKTLCFEGLTSDEVEIPPGVTFLGHWTPPKSVRDCEQNNLCRFLVTVIKVGIDFEFYFNPKDIYMVLSASISGKFQFSDSIFFENIKLDIRVDKEVSVTMGGILQIKNKDAFGPTPLSVEGKLSFELATISLMFSMKGDMKLPSIPIRFKELSVTGILNLGSPPEISFSMSSLIGKDNVPEERLISCKMIGGLAFNIPYFYVNIDGLNMRRICQAFDLPCTRVPEDLHSFHFKDDLLISFSNQEIITQQNTIPAGFQMSGRLVIKTFQCSVNISITKNNFLIQIEMTPIRWAGGKILFQRSSTSDGNGPLLYMHFQKTGVKVQISGYMDIFSTVSGVTILIDHNHMKFTIEGDVQPGLHASLNAKASWDLMNPHFEITGFADAEKITKEFSDRVEEYLTAVRDTFLNPVKQISDKLDSTLAKGKDFIEEFNNRLDRIADEINAEKEKVNSELELLDERSQHNKCLERCGYVTITLPTYVSHCKEWFGIWFGCIRLEKVEVQNVGCIARCLADKFLRYLQEKTMELKSWLSDKAIMVLDVVKGLSSHPLKWMEIIKEKFNKFHEKVKDILKLVSLPSPVIVIKTLAIKLKMDRDTNFCGRFSVTDVILLGEKREDINLKYCANAKDVFASLVKRASPGIRRAKKSVGSGEKLEKSLQRNERVLKTELRTAEREKDNLLGESEGILSKDNKRNDIPNVPENEDIHLEFFEMSKQFDELTARGNIPDDVMQMYQRNAINTSFSAIEKRSLIYGDDLSPCSRLKKSLIHYKDLSNVLADSFNTSLEYEKFVKQDKRSTINDLNQLKSYLKEIGYNVLLSDSEKNWFWYNKALQAHNARMKKQKIFLREFKKHNLPMLRKQLDMAVTRGMGTRLDGFLDLVHGQAMIGHKRSNIPNEGEQALHRIKKALEASLWADEDSDLPRLNENLYNARNQIENLANKISKSCVLN